MYKNEKSSSKRIKGNLQDLEKLKTTKTIKTKDELIKIVSEPEPI